LATEEYVTTQGYITGYTETDPIYTSERDALLLNKTSHPTLLFSTLADYNKPSGYSTMIQPSSYQNPLPSHGYYHIIARRDTGGGYGAFLQSYNSHELYHGNTTESTSNISWYKIWNSGDFTSTNVSNWNTAYNDRITAAAVTGTSTKTLTLTQGDGTTLTTTWVDYDTDTDAQTLTWEAGTKTLGISGGNDVTLDGLATEEFVTSQGYITGYTETDTLSSVIGRGNTASAAIFTGDSQSRVLYLRGSGNIIQFQDASSANKWEVVGREGQFYIYKNDGTGSGYKYQIDTNGNHTITGDLSVTGGFSASGYNKTNWDTAYNDKINSASFNTTNGVLTLTQQDGGTVTVDLDGRYVSSDSDSQELTWDIGSKTLGITNGNSVILDLATEDFVTSQGYITGYTETDTLDSVTDRNAVTTNAITVGGLTVDTTTLVVDSANDRVGIGTASPSYKLDVNVANNSDALRVQQAGASRFILNGDGVMTWGGGASNGYLSWDTNLAIVGGQTNNSLALYAGASEKVRITTGGNFLIGTTTDSGQKLVVSGSSDTRVQIDSTSTQGLYFTKSGANNGTFRVNTDGDYEFYTKNVSQAVVIKAGGNVGIGTTSPNAKLDVVASDNAIISVRQSNAPGASKYAQIVLTHGTTYFGANDKSYQLVSNSLGSGEADFAIQYWNGTSYNERMRVTSAGNVGIGTTNPVTILDVNSSTSDSVAFFRSSDNRARIGVEDNDTAVYVIAEDSYASFGLSNVLSSTNLNINGSGNVGIGTTSPSLDSLGTGLDILNNRYTQLRVRSSASSAGIEFKPSTGNKWEIQATNDSATSFIVYDRTNEAYRMVIDTGGNVGIGTTDPTTKLDVNGVITATGGTSTNWNAAYNDKINSASFNTSDGVLTLTQQDGGTVTVDLDGRYLTSETDSQTLEWDGVSKNISITNGNTVTLDGLLTSEDLAAYGYISSESDTLATVTGRGATTTNAITVGNLRVVGGSNTFQFAQKLAKSSYADTGGHTTLIGLGCENAAWSRSAIGHTRTTSYDAGYLGFYVSNNSSDGTELQQSDLRMMINRDGNVGIGTTSPSYKLDVSSDVRFGGGITLTPINGNLYATDGALSYYSSTNGVYLNGAGTGGWLRLNASGEENNVNSIDIYGQASGGYMIFRTGNSTRLTILNGGNVGIGNTNPSYKLDVAGAGRFNGNVALITDAASGDYSLIQHNYNGSTKAFSGYNSGFALYGGEGGVDTRLQAGGQYALSIKNDTLNVGIGVTDPEKKLEVKSDTTYDGILIDTLSAPEIVLRDRGNSDTLVGTGRHGLDSFHIDTYSGNAFFIKGDTRSVGIGTTSPIAKLDVRGDVALVKTTTVNADFGGPVLSLGDSTSEVGMCGGIAFAELLGSSPRNVTMGIYYDGKANKMHFTGSSDAQATPGENLISATKHMTIMRDSGLVGIGTASPTSRLSISDGVAMYAAQTGLMLDIKRNVTNGNDTTSRTGIRLGNNSNGFAIYYGGTSDRLRFIDGGEVEVLSLVNGGNIGIGNTNPSTKLHVNGVITATGGTSTDWNTAYGWGNHADYGYWNINDTDTKSVQSELVRFVGDVEVQGTLTESSSIRFKENIKPLEPSLGKVEQLNPVTYNKIGVLEEEIGLIAEEVAELFPEVVTYNEEGLVSGVQYQRLSVILLKAVQELTERVNKLENK